MRRLLLVLSTALSLAFGAPAAADSAVDPAEWSSAVSAMADVDPSLAAPSFDPQSVEVVGGGKAIPNGFPAFAVSARGVLHDVTGQMTLVEGFGNTFRADVVCLGAVTLAGGGGFAHLVGALSEPAFGVSPTLEFFVTDSAQPGGAGDEWNAQFNPLPPEAVSCAPSPAVSPIASGNIIVTAGN
jgi:hypothetical protein